MAFSRKRQKPKTPKEAMVIALIGKLPKEKLHRPGITLECKVEALLAQGVLCPCGCGEIIKKGEGQFDHWPALELRTYDPATKKYSPDANDPKFMAYRKTGHHDKKTNGPGGEKRITAKGGDNHTRKHIDAQSASHRDFLERMQKAGKPVPQRRF